MLHCDALSKARRPCRKLLNALCGRHSGYRNAKTMFRIQQKLQVRPPHVLIRAVDQNPAGVLSSLLTSRPNDRRAGLAAPLKRAS